MTTADDIQFASYPDLKDKVVFVTGIGQSGSPSLTIWGNGASIARLMAYQGAKVFGCDVNPDAAQRTQKRIQELIPGADVTVTQADVTRDQDVKRAVEECVKRYGRVDVLVNNVGRSEPGDPATMPESVWDAQTDINLKSVYLTCHHVLPLMTTQQSPPGGSIVNISSIAGLRYIGKPQVAYSATKAGVIQFTKATAVIYAEKGVRLNVVVPGLMHTPLVTMLAEKYAGGDLEGFVEKRNRAVPVGAMGSGEDVAMAVGWLASAQSRYVTGQKIVVDGGVTSATR